MEHRAPCTFGGRCDMRAFLQGGDASSSIRSHPQSPFLVEAVSLDIYNHILMSSHMMFHLGCFGELR